MTVPNPVPADSSRSSEGSSTGWWRPLGLIQKLTASALVVLLLVTTGIAVMNANNVQSWSSTAADLSAEVDGLEQQVDTLQGINDSLRAQADEVESRATALDRRESELDARESELSAMEAAAEAEAARSEFGSGVHVVGETINAGVYRTAGSRFCYYAFLSGTGADATIIDNNIVENGPATVTLSDGDVFESNDCGTWRRAS